MEKWINKDVLKAREEFERKVNQDMVNGGGWLKELQQEKLKRMRELREELEDLKEKYGKYDLDYSVNYGHGDSTYSKVYLVDPTSNKAFRTSLSGYGNLHYEEDKMKVHIDAYKEIFKT